MYEWIGRWTNGRSLLFRIVRYFVAKLPLWVSYGFCVFTASLVFKSQKKLHRTIEQNIQQLLGPFTRNEVRLLVNEYFRNLVLTLFELLFLSDRLDQQKNEWIPFVTISGENNLKGSVANGKGAIVFAPHVGNFFIYYWYLCKHYDCLAVATASSAELRPIYERFAAIGCKGLDYDRTPPLEMIRKLKRHLQSGGIVFLMGDFYRSSFPEATFFGRNTCSPRGAAMLALQLDVPIIPMVSHRVKQFTHSIQFQRSINLRDRFAINELREATDSLNCWMEQVIRERPSDWFYWFQVEERWVGLQGMLNLK